MATGTPLTRIALVAASVADDLGYVALADVARVIGDLAEDYRVIGGHMVTVLVARWKLGDELYRETGDVDLGVPPIVATDHGLASRIKGLNYQQVAGNRFARGVPDIPAGVKQQGSSGTPEALIDILVPAYTSHARANVQVGDDLFTTEVPGLQQALARQPVSITLEMRRLNGDTLQCSLPFADEVSALVLKGFATRIRSRDTDITDVWRCLEIAFAAGAGPDAFATGARAESAELIRSLFKGRSNAARAALAAGQRLSPESVDARLTRIRALIARVLG
jgi:hypothetical protein